MAEVIIFGDSVAHGAWDERGGWADRLKQYFNQQKLEHPKSSCPLLCNLAMDGDTADDLVKRMPQEIAVRRKPWSTDHDLYVVAIGGNDSRALESRDNVVSTPEHFRDQLTKIIEIIKSYSSNMLFIGPEAVLDAASNFEGNIYWNERIRLFNDEMRSVCKEHDIPFIDVFDDSEEHLAKQLWFVDGLHPNTAGHQWLYERIQPKVLELL